MRLLGAALSLLVVSLAVAEPAKKDQSAPEGSKKAKAAPAQAEGAKGKHEPKAETKADAGTKKGKAAPAAGATKAAEKEATKAAIDSYAAIPLAERVSIQSDLIWTGDYNGVVSGEFAERSIAAVKAFQKRSGAKETGVLNPQERAALAAAAKLKQEAVGWRIVDDMITGARIGVPSKLMPNTQVTGGVSRWSSSRNETSVETFRIAGGGTTLGAVFERMKKEPVGRRAEYGVLKDDFFVISGLQNLKKFYVRAQLKGDEVRGLTILYDQAMAGIMEPVVVAMSSAYAAFPSGRAAAPPPRRKVEYATGVAVGTGQIVASREALEGCYVTTIAGIGGADRLADDKASGLVLLRVHGANLKPVALGTAAPKGADVTLVGIADPQAQGGGGAASTAKARVSDTLALEPAPALGFDGAAALDGQGRLAGLAVLNVPVVAGTVPILGATATLAPVETLRNFLDANKLPPAQAALSGADAAKASVVRVICVRK